jgi:hypothetical protein
LTFGLGVNFPPLIRDGEIVALLVDSPKRSPLFPGAPTLVEQGYTERLNRNHVDLVVPSATPPPIANWLHTAVITRQAVELGYGNGTLAASFCERSVSKPFNAGMCTYALTR